MNLIKRQTPWFTSFGEDFFKNDWNTNSPSFSTTVPAVNIHENDATFQIDLAVPGKKKADFEIEIEDGLLSIASQEKQDKTSEEGKFTRREFSYNSFKRSFTIPESVDVSKIDATYSSGVLTISLPKKEEALPQPKKLIKIQ